MTLSDALYSAGALVVSLGGGAVLVIGLSSWLGKLWAERILKHELAEMARITYEHNTRFSSIHLKQAELIAELYALLHELRDGVRSLSASDNPFKDPEKESWDLMGSASKANEFYQKSRIYFSEALSGRMEIFIKTCDEASHLYLRAQYHDNPGEKEERVRSAKNTLLKTREDTERALDQMVIDFRTLLGVPK